MPNGGPYLNSTLRQLVRNWTDEDVANNGWRQVSMDRPVRQRTRPEREKR